MIDKADSMQCNSLLARHLREFPNQAVGGAGGVGGVTGCFA